MNVYTLFRNYRYPRIYIDHLIKSSHVYNRRRSSDFLEAEIVDNQLIHTVTKFEIDNSKFNNGRGHTNKWQPHANPLRADVIV